MTIRRDRNRDSRRIVATLADAFICPDCHAAKRLAEQAPGVFVLDVEHDETCPVYRAMIEGTA